MVALNRTRIEILNCKSCRVIDRNAELFGTEVIAMAGHWREDVDGAAWMDGMPEIGGLYPVTLSGPLVLELHEPIWLLQTGFAFFWNGNHAQESLDTFRFCWGVPTVAFTQTEDSLTCGFLVEQMYGLRDLLNLRPRALHEGWQFAMDAMLASPSLLKRHGDYAVLSANSQGDVGYDFIFLQQDGQWRMVCAHLWSMHESFWYGGNFVPGPQEQAFLQAHL